MEELRIDCRNQTAEELAKAKELRQNIFRLNHTMPDTEEYDELLHKVFPNLGEGCRIETPFSGVRTVNVKFGSNVSIRFTTYFLEVFENIWDKIWRN